MNTLRTNSSRFTWLAVGLALFTELIYILVAFNVLGVGDPQVARDGGAIIYAAAGCYLLGGLLILLRSHRRYRQPGPSACRRFARVKKGGLPNTRVYLPSLADGARSAAGRCGIPDQPHTPSFSREISCLMKKR